MTTNDIKNRLTIETFKIEAKSILKTTKCKLDEQFLADGLIKPIVEVCEEMTEDKFSTIISEPNDDLWTKIYEMYLVEMKCARFGEKEKSLQKRVFANKKVCELLATLMVKLFDAKRVARGSIPSFRVRKDNLGEKTVRLYWQFKAERSAIPWGLRLCLDNNYATLYPFAIYGDFRFLDLIEELSDDEGEKEVKVPESFDSLPLEFQVGGLDHEVMDAESRLEVLKTSYMEETERLDAEIRRKQEAARQAKQAAKKKRQRNVDKDFLFEAFGSSEEGCDFVVKLAGRFKKLRADASQHFSGIPLYEFLGIGDSEKSASGVHGEGQPGESSLALVVPPEAEPNATNNESIETTLEISNVENEKEICLEDTEKDTELAADDVADFDLEKYAAGIQKSLDMPILVATEGNEKADQSVEDDLSNVRHGVEGTTSDHAAVMDSVEDKENTETVDTADGFPATGHVSPQLSPSTEFEELV